MGPQQIRKLRNSAKEACGLLSVLAHEDRLVLLCQLTRSEHSVGELEELVGLHQPSLSQHLGVLRREGLVETRREGKKIFYSLCSPEALAIIESLYAQYCGARAARPARASASATRRKTAPPARKAPGASLGARGKAAA